MTDQHSFAKNWGTIGKVAVGTGLMALAACVAVPYGPPGEVEPSLALLDSSDVFQPDSGANAAALDSAPILTIENFNDTDIASLAQDFETLGLSAPTLYALHPQYPEAKAPHSLSLPKMTFIVFREGGWDKGALLETVKDLPKRYDACGIGINDILVIETRLDSSAKASVGGLDFDVLMVDNYHRLSPLIQNLPVHRRPLFFFVGSVYSDLHQASVGGFAANTLSEFGSAQLPNLGRSSPIARTGAIARRPKDSTVNYQFDQTISHEIGHLLGLRHERGDDPNNIMRPVTCKDCDFTARQCARMRESSMLERR